MTMGKELEDLEADLCRFLHHYWRAEGLVSLRFSMRFDAVWLAGSIGLAVTPAGLAFAPLSKVISMTRMTRQPLRMTRRRTSTRASEADSTHNYHDYQSKQAIETSQVAADENHSDESALEYWLDLRGISVSPNEAVQFLNTLMETTTAGDQSTTIDSIVTRILMDKTEFSDRVEAETLDIAGNQSLLLFSDGSVTAYQAGLPQIDTFATVINAEPGQNLDAMLAMDAVLKHGRWVFVDGDPKSIQDSAQWMTQQVSALYDLLVSSYAATDANVVGSLILPQSSASRGQSSSGGVAVMAATVSALVDLDFTLMQAALTRQMKSTTEESDLLLPTEATPPSLRTALVIPFDVDLWRVVLDLKQA